MLVSRTACPDLPRVFLERVDMNDLQARRPAALTDLVSAFAPALYRFVSRIVGQEADAEDVVQHTFTAVVAGIGRFQGSPDGLRSWVFSIAYRAAMDVLRGRHRAVPLRDDDARSTSEPVDLETAAADLRKAFGLLGATDQYLLTLKYQDDFTNQDIGEILGITANHVGVLLYRAKQNLRKAMP
jgi:RNA polymerase sigma-70 factor, ECF subfamily